MPADRLKVREIDGRYQVYDGADVLGTFTSIVEMARFVRERGARFWLDWGRTVINGNSLPHDFSPKFLGSDSVGRVMGETNGPSAGIWSWSCSTHDRRWRGHGGGRGTCNTKDLAVTELEVEFTRYIADTPDGWSPYAQAKGL